MPNFIYHQLIFKIIYENLNHLISFYHQRFFIFIDFIKDVFYYLHFFIIKLYFLHF
jgi:hypothetical protein